MSYQVLALKWRPQRFDDVVGQHAVTRTLRNAITSGRLAHAFVFAGPRGCGKTTTARILARALNCVKGPTADPCGECDACVEIAQGRDIDVMEIDAASHTQVDTIREVVLANLAFAPVRNRYKVFIIDEVHQLSSHSFNALLKSIEEPPAHVVFMMATTELHKIPDTILSRSQVFEFRTISTKAIVDQLRRIMDAEKIEVSDAALALIARAAEGSMRDAQSALDQVIAFAGQKVGVDDVSTVLGLVGRDLLFDLLDAVVDEDGPRAFALCDRAVESGHDLKLVCRELTHVVRDLMIVSVDPSRAGEGEVAAGELERLTQLAGRFSKEDLMRAFDLLAKTEQDIRAASHPRHHFEMALLRWMHLRKLVPLSELLEQLPGGAQRGPASPAPRTNAPSPARPTSPSASSRQAPGPSSQARTSVPPQDRTAAPAPPRPTSPSASSRQAPDPPSASSRQAPDPPSASSRQAPDPPSASSRQAPDPPSQSRTFKDSLLAEIRSGKGFFYNTVVATAQTIDVSDDRVTFAFLPTHRVLREQFEQQRSWLEAAAERIAGRKVSVVAVQVAGSAEPQAEPAAKAAPEKRDLKAEALSSPAVQAVLDVFHAEIRDVEEV